MSLNGIITRKVNALSFGALTLFFTLGSSFALGSGPEFQVIEQKSDPVIVGTPWTGARGITESIAQIMAPDAATNNNHDESPRPTKKLFYPPCDDCFNNPNSPAVSQWPPIASGSRSLFHPGDSLPDLPQTVGTSWIRANLGSSGFIPQDSMGAVGPTQFLVGVNGRIRLWSKTGAIGTLDTTTNTFFASVLPATGVTSDPQVRYDRLSGRWFVSILTVI